MEDGKGARRLPAPASMTLATTPEFEKTDNEVPSGIFDPFVEPSEGPLGGRGKKMNATEKPTNRAARKNTARREERLLLAEASSRAAPTPTPTPREGLAHLPFAPAAAAAATAATARKVAAKTTTNARVAPTPTAAAAVAAVPPSAAVSAVPPSRTICLRTLRGKTPQQLSSSSSSSSVHTSLAGWGGFGGAPGCPASSSAKAVEARDEQGDPGQESSPPLPPSPSVPVAVGQTGTTVVIGTGGGGISGSSVLPLTNKVVDLRDVKKVRSGPLAVTSVMPTSTSPTSDDGDGEEPAGFIFEEDEAEVGPVKIDISAGKRMIEFQLKLNAVEEKREAARLKSEKERADTAAAEETQRMLAQINARIESQRRGRGGGGLLGAWDGKNVFGSETGHSITQDHIRTLAQKHGIVVNFVDDEGDASGISQVRALAKAHGIRIRVLEDDYGSDCYSEEGTLGEGGTTTPAKTAENGVALEAGGVRGRGSTIEGVTTPPPMLSSLRPASVRAIATVKRSPSPALLKSGKALSVPMISSACREGGAMLLSGSARMMRRALQASGGSTPAVGPGAAKDTVGPVPTIGRRDKKNPTASSETQEGRAQDSSDKPLAASVASSTGGPSLSEEGPRKRVACGEGIINSRPKGSHRASPCLAKSVGGSSAGAGAAGDVDENSSSNSSSSSTSFVSGQKRRGATSNDTSRDHLGLRVEVDDPNAADNGITVVGGGGRESEERKASSGQGIAGRLGPISEIRLAVGKGLTRGTRKSMGSIGAATEPIVSQPPKRMRLVAPTGGVVYKSPSKPLASAEAGSARAARRRSLPEPGGAAWKPVNNNLFKGAMAGIIGRGKRPAQ